MSKNNFTPEEKDAFWDTCIRPLIPDIISGKIWPEFTQRSITEFKKRGFVIEHKGNWCIGHRNEAFVVDYLGNCLKFSYRGKMYSPSVIIKIDVC